MDNAQILKLVDAGFSADEIRKMETETGADQGKTDPEPKAPETQTKVPSGEVTPPDNNEVLTQLTNTVAELSKTVKELQAGNIDKAKGSAPSTGDKIKDVMDSFIKEL